MRVKNTLWPRNRKGQILEGGPSRGNTSRTQPIGLLVVVGQRLAPLNFRLVLRFLEVGDVDPGMRHLVHGAAAAPLTRVGVVAVASLLSCHAVMAITVPAGRIGATASS